MAAFTYEYRVNGLQKHDANTVGEVLERLEASQQGLTPETLLDASRDENAVLHDEFEWDDSIAGEKYRLVQARQIITNLRAVIDAEPQKVEQYKERVFVNVERGSTAYVKITNAMTNETWRQALLDQAKRDAELFVAKYKRLSELADAVNDLREFIKAS